jgi:hypothetical protein
MDPSINTNSTTYPNDENDVEVDYGDPESPTPAVQPAPTSFTTVADLRHATSSTIDADLTTGVGVYHGSEPSQAINYDDMEVTSLPSSKITTADSTTTR